MSKKKEEEKKIKIQMVGGTLDQELTGSSTLVFVDGLKIVVDMGLIQSGKHPKEVVYTMNQREFPINYSEIDYVLLTHINCDHVSKVGLLGRGDSEFKGKVLCTKITEELLPNMLQDSAYLLEKDMNLINKKRPKHKLEQIYTMSDAENVLQQVYGYKFDEEIKLNSNVSVIFLSSGHIAGASSILLKYKINEYNTKTVLFSGDTSFKDEKPFTMKWKYENLDVDAVILEQTYAGRYHKLQEKPIYKLERLIMENVSQENKILFMPSFAISRTTQLIYMLYEIFNRNKYLKDSNIPIYIASPMSCKVHMKLNKQEFYDLYDEKWSKYRDMFIWDRVRYISSFDDMKNSLLNNRPKIVISSSGMLTGGYSSYLAQSYLPNKNVLTTFVGYQSEGTVGKKILEYKETNQNSVVIEGKQVRIKCDVDFLDGMSSHADSNGLKGYLRSLNKNKLKTIILNHGGDIEKTEEFASEVGKEFSNSDVLIPKYQEIIKI